MPKYASTRDPQIVLNYFKSLDNDNVFLEVLSKKLITLLALVTGQRIQTLSLIDTKYIVVKKDSLEIRIPERVKTSNLGRNQPILCLPFYEENWNICPVRILQVYVEKTKELRKDTLNLFISFKKPFKNISTQTLSRWVKDMLRESGVNTKIFSAHSTRHAATLAAK